MFDYMEVLRGEPELAAVYPGVAQDKLFETTYRHMRDGLSCKECACDGKLIPRARLSRGDRQPAVHFGLIASGDTVIKSGKDRDDIARETGVIGFEMESSWRMAAVCGGNSSRMYEGFFSLLDASNPRCVDTSEFIVPYPRNESFVGRSAVLDKLKQLMLKSASQARVALYGLGEMSVFWVHASNAERFRQAYTSIAQECRVPGYDDSKTDILTLVKKWLERKDCCPWMMVIDNADDTQLFFGRQRRSETDNREENLARYLPECLHGIIIITTRNKQAGSRLTKGKRLIEVGFMDDGETNQLLRAHLDGISAAPGEFSTLSSRLEHLPLALVQAAAFIQENSIDVRKYLELLDSSDQNLINLLSEEFETEGRDSETPRAVAETWFLSFEQIQWQDVFASELLSLMSFLDRQAIPMDFLCDYSKQQQDQEVRGEMQLTKALGILKAFSFVAVEKDHGLDMHRLVQLVTQKWLAKEGRMKHFAGQALLTVSHCYPFGCYETREVCSAYLAHAYAVLGSEGTASRDEKAGRATLLNFVAGFLRYRGQWKDAERLQLEAVTLREEVTGSDHPDTLTSMANLASTYWNQGRWEEAEKLGIQVMEACMTKLGADHPDTLTSMANLASTYWNQGRREEAEQLGMHVLETRKTKLGANHPDTLASMNNLAFIWKYMGRHRDAIDLIQNCFDLQQQVLGVGYPSTVSTRSSLEAWLKENEH
ncbi:hypothetical protein P885DRAFT_66493 [Corynascus similis CBS 632.67]